MALARLNGLVVFVLTICSAILGADDGIGRTYTSANTTSCKQIGHGKLHGCEDIIVDPETGLAYLACGSLKPRQHWMHPGDEYDFANEVEKDRIFVIDEADNYTEIKTYERAVNRSLKPFSQDLRVHGFDIYWDPADSNDMTFMLVNHQLDHAAVSIFSYRRGSNYMVHVETVSSSLLKSPNNIVAMSKRAFYATNDMKYTGGILRAVSNNLRLANGHVVYRNDSGKFNIGRTDKNLIYVASCTDPGIQIYRSNVNGNLEYQGRTLFWNSIPDNIHVDHSTGQLYCTGFLKVSQTHRYFKSPSLNTTATAGTKILRLTPRDDPRQGFDTETLLIDSGVLMPTATIAALQRRNQIQRLLIGCAVCNFLVVCDSAI
ncbi:hypothetical protein BX661DRAFT_177081 [Kickxella alabastrina]|uniref:uncharacterized protein n=1 Tax=Kickxella alabastrina TaxID=61397 RepID=UPI002220C045|nr:uncharacterized protein BX661DRAFT_177081 [Kickxella alabastrina]KAI7834361.1 hypothetical protein BX661DRAFT_177081 [Kickxella alabastrina]